MRTAFIKGRLQEATFPRGPRSRVLVVVVVVALVDVVIIFVVVASDDPVYNGSGLLGPRGHATSLTPTQTIPFLHFPSLSLSLSVLAFTYSPSSFARNTSGF